MSGTTTAQTGGGFNVRVIGALILAGIVGFIGFAILTAFAPEMGSGNDGGAHGLSRSATGFSGIVALANASDTPVRLVRSAEDPLSRRSDSLLVLTPPHDMPAEDLVTRIGNHSGMVLVILPKHSTMPDTSHRGWVRRVGDHGNPAGSLHQIDSGIDAVVIRTRADAVTGTTTTGARVTVPIPRDVQLITNGGVEPLISAGDGILLGRLRARPQMLVLSDPDILNNLSMRDGVHATAALNLLRGVAEPDAPIGFDVVLNGFGSGSRSLLRTAFVPPFLGLTLCLIAATLFALWQGFVRFGPPLTETRNIALGKAGLVTNGAQLIVQARRIPDFAPRYGAMVREAAARRLHAPSGLSGPALDRWLDRFVGASGKRFSVLLAALERSQTPDDVVRSAAALGQWRKEVVRDSD